MIDAMTKKSDAAKQAYGYQIEAYSDTNQAVLDQMAGTNAQKAGQIGAESSLLSGAATVAGKFSNMPGMPGGSTGNIGSGGST